MSFYKHRAYIASKPYVAIQYKDGIWKQVRGYINISPVSFLASDGQVFMTSDSQEFMVHARDTDLLS